MKKREFISLIIAISMMISASSCGSSDKASSGGDTNGGGDIVAEKSDAPAGDVKEAAEAPAAAGAALGDTAGKTAAAEEADAEYALATDVEVMLDGGTADTARGAADGDLKINAVDEYVMAVDEPADGDEPSDETPPDTDSSKTDAVKIPEAGQLTAGEWNDNDNWGFFSNLVNAGTIKFPSFSLDPTTRCAVKVKTADGKPAVNAKVRLLDEDGKVIWSAISDKKGSAYLFTTSTAVPATIEAELGGETKTAKYKVPEADEQGNKKLVMTETEITLDGESKLYTDTEVMFIVDTTGSMSDEMLFLQSEFSAITREIGSDNVKYAVSFYRDEGDDYVTKHNGFTSSVDELQRALNNESADGGGDYPEAVAQVLTETITEGKWSNDSVKLAFLIFDAPPHAGTEKELLAAAKAAGEKGIRIVPVVSSDSDRDTELFARSLAIMSGGTYVFLTDDSGIGGGHLEPIIGDYKVEKLYDIIIRVINDYRQ